nr:hypothetical protein GCM10020093_004150 [Planobispora longispora]
MRNKLKTLLQMAIVLTYAAKVPVVKIGRMAGQFAKPRSKGTETRAGVELPAYRGDMVNGLDFTPEARIPDPERLVQAYHSSAVTLNLIRAFTKGGYADLRQVHAWNQDFVAESPAGKRYEQLAREIDQALAFMRACGADPEEFHTVEFYSSHEALILDYDQALTRIDSRTGLPYDVSAHMVWIGERTRQLGNAHVEFFASIRNPIGVKLGPTTSVDDALALIDKLNPDNEPGRLSFITRMGAPKIRKHLPELVEKVTASGAQVAWICDPMHGNTFEAPSGHKTRRLDDVLDEVAASSRCTARSARTPAASTSSSPVTTSPSAWAAARRSSRVTWRCATRPPATPASTAASHSTSPSAWPSSTAPPDLREPSSGHRAKTRTVRGGRRMIISRAKPTNRENHPWRTSPRLSTGSIPASPTSPACTTTISAERTTSQPTGPRPSRSSRTSPRPAPRRRRTGPSWPGPYGPWCRPGCARSSTSAPGCRPGATCTRSPTGSRPTPASPTSTTTPSCARTAARCSAATTSR